MAQIVDPNGGSWPTATELAKLHDGLRARLIVAGLLDPYAWDTFDAAVAKIDDPLEIGRLSNGSGSEPPSLTYPLFGPTDGVDPTTRQCMPLDYFQERIIAVAEKAINVRALPSLFAGVTTRFDTAFNYLPYLFEPLSDPDAVGNGMADFWDEIGTTGEGFTRNYPRTIDAVTDSGTSGHRARIKTDDSLSAGVYEYDGSDWLLLDDPDARPDTLTDHGVIQQFDYIGPWVWNEMATGLEVARAIMPVDGRIDIEPDREATNAFGTTGYYNVDTGQGVNTGPTHADVAAAYADAQGNEITDNEETLDDTTGENAYFYSNPYFLNGFRINSTTSLAFVQTRHGQVKPKILGKFRGVTLDDTTLKIYSQQIDVEFPGSATTVNAGALLASIASGASTRVEWGWDDYSPTLPPVGEGFSNTIYIAPVFEFSDYP